MAVDTAAPAGSVVRLKHRIAELREETGGADDCGWMVDEVCWLLFGLVRFWKPDLVIQTGHLWGKSALVALEALRDEKLDQARGMGDPKYAEFVEENAPRRGAPQLLSVDPSPRGGIELLREWYPNFHFYEESSAQFFEDFTMPPTQRLMGIVDGDHTEAGAMGDLKALAKMGAGLIVLDDTSWIPHLRAVGHGIGYMVLELDAYNGLMLLVRGL